MHHSKLAFAALALLATALPLTAQDSWISGPDMSLTRQRHCATLLSDGRLLVTGGAYDFWGEIATATCEIYNPLTETWTNAASMSVARSSHTATLLPNGMVFVSGGFNGRGYALASAEVYDPINNRWMTADSMAYRRYRHQAIVLGDDAIMVVGGRQGNVDGTGPMTIWAPVSTCEIYNIGTNTWTSAASMNETRVESGLALLPDGRVLAAGGINDTLIISNWSQPASQTCEIYDPVTDAWTLTDGLQSARNFVRLATLDDNTVLSIGGEYDKQALYDSEIFDVTSATWSPTDSLGSPRIVGEVVKLPSGDVMTIGGWSYLWSSQTGTVETFSATDAEWSPFPSLQANRGWHTASLLYNGDILVAGGTTSDGSPLKSTELYRINNQTFAIAAVSDAAGDEGGFVRLYWNRHQQDIRGAQDGISGYVVYLRDDVYGEPVPGVATGKWRVVGSATATGLDRYALTVPSLETSTRTVRRPSEYVVGAVKSGAGLAVTAIESGSSFDNRGPAGVQALRAVTGGSSFELSWSASSSTDVGHYEIFSGSSPDFATDRSLLIGTSEVPHFSTSSAVGRYLRVRVIDRASNPGPATPSISSDGTSQAPDASPSMALSVGDAYPLPASSVASVPITLASSETVSIAVFDQLSRLVSRVERLDLPAGRNDIRLELGELAPGAYICIVSAGGLQHTAKLTVAR